MVITKHVILVIGKGGVGKTTVSILLSLTLTDLGNSLLYSLDPAKHLIKYLGISDVMRHHKIADKLYACQLDLDVAIKKISDHYVELIRELSPSLSVLNLDNIVNTIKYSPGIEEEVFIRELHKLYTTEDYDYVVVDTPPTGITLRTLILPKLYTVWIEKLIEIRERIISLRYSIARTLGKEFKFKDSVLEKLYEQRNIYTTLWESIKSSNTSFVLVTNPETMPLLEVHEVIKFLNTEFSKEPKLLVMNKYTNTPESEEVMRSFNQLPYSKVFIRKVDKPPSTLGDMVELLKNLDKDELLKHFK